MKFKEKFEEANRYLKTPTNLNKLTRMLPLFSLIISLGLPNKLIF